MYTQKPAPFPYPSHRERFKRRQVTPPRIVSASPSWCLAVWSIRISQWRMERWLYMREPVQWNYVVGVCRKPSPSMIIIKRMNTSPLSRNGPSFDNVYPIFSRWVKPTNQLVCERNLFYWSPWWTNNHKRLPSKYKVSAVTSTTAPFLGSFRPMF